MAGFYIKGYENVIFFLIQGHFHSGYFIWFQSAGDYVMGSDYDCLVVVEEVSKTIVL